MAQKRNFKIETPRGSLQVVKVTRGEMSGTVHARLKWNEGFGPKYQQGFSNAQEFVDSECLRHMDPLTPRRSGYMIKSAQLGTVIGSGQIEYLAPYARRQYYEHQGDGGNRGRLWFERMKSAKGEAIRKGAARFVANS